MKLNWTALAASVLLVASAATSVAAQGKDAPTVWTLTVSPSAERKPSLQYRFDHAMHEQVEGNGAPILATALQLLPREDAGTVDDLLGQATTDAAAARAAPEPYAASLRYAELAMKRASFDSGTTLREEGFAALLPSLS